MLSSSKRRRVSFSTGTQLITKQSHKSECDINNILSQFKRTGIINHITSSTPNYSDLPSDLDFQEALNIQIQADAAFDALPSVVRRYFDNDPSGLLQALGDPEQHPKLRELGILREPDAPQPPGNPVPPTSVPLQGEPKLP